MKNESNIVGKVSQQVFTLLKDELPESIVYHNYQHTKEVVDNCEDLIKYYKLSDEDAEVLLLTAWLHDVGYTKDYENHESEGQKIAADLLKKLDYSEKKTEQVVALIGSTHIDHKPTNLMEELIHDADFMHIGTKGFFNRAALLRIEWARHLDKKYTDPEWNQVQLDFLINTDFVTEYGQNKRGTRRGKNIDKQRKAFHKSVANKQKKKINKLKSNKLGRGIETMYRTTYRNHINLSSIADAKANMMISLNTIIMSVIITVVGSGFAFSGGLFQSTRFSIPIGILLLGSLIAVIFAVISARPVVTNKKVNFEKIKNKKSSILFFGNFSKLELPDFITNMQELKKDQDMLYDNMSIDIYYLGKVLTRKYRLLRYSYTIFIIGLTLSVVSFVALFIYSNG